MSGIVVDGIPFYGSFIPPGKKIVKLLPFDKVVKRATCYRDVTDKIAELCADARRELAQSAIDNGCTVVLDFKEDAPVSEDEDRYFIVVQVYGTAALLVDED